MLTAVRGGFLYHSSLGIIDIAASGFIRIRNGRRISFRIIRIQRLIALGIGQLYKTSRLIIGVRGRMISDGLRKLISALIVGIRFRDSVCIIFRYDSSGCIIDAGGGISERIGGRCQISVGIISKRGYISVVITAAYFSSLFIG